MNLPVLPAARPRIDVVVLDKRLGTEFPMPAYATPGSAAMDMRAMLDEPMTLQPGDTALVPSGIKMHLADENLMAVLVPRSGLGHRQGLVMSLGTGVLDSSYVGQIQIALWNRGKEAVEIQPGDRVAQMIVVPVLQIEWNVVDELPDTDRGAGGFGSTGKS